ncbi:metallophosphoesterase [Nocardia sp. CDC159]|uniref:Metallophosphoesterase n=1 Tax=Nocardia pulmonis TaxID=2951408 RepID=A0A9X2E9A9_9NOCA|nr:MULTISPECIES: metallophosphoesterase [Nocardia]MCM6775323.1 metallophosphoesterase [Nocardia pulmonis]MCM6787943.1 metallophosphoesterase [Nocardia sp. CDC159]
MGHHLSRRTVLTAMTATAAALPMDGLALLAAQPHSMVPRDLELITVSDRSVAVSWTTVATDPLGLRRPVAADTELALGPADSRKPLPVVHFDATPTPYHYVEITGLEPGRRYRLEARSRGVRAVAGMAPRWWNDEQKYEFQTLTPPPGRLLRTIALANDLHFGEEISGQIVPALPTGVRQERGLPPYPEVMLDALLSDVRQPDRGVDHLILAGDLTNAGTPGESREVRRRLDRWGGLGRDVLVCRGNHDRPRVGAQWRAGPRLPGTAHHDCWGEHFLPRQRLVEYDLDGLRVIGLDTTDLDGAGGRIDPDQMSRLRGLLCDEPGRPTLVFGHHPVTRQSALTNLGGPGFVLDRHDAATLHRLYERAPGVFLHHSGHTHRTRRTRPDTPIPVEFLEVAAIKEYPTGYALLRLYEGGYMLTFHTTRTAAARRWSARTRTQSFGLQASYSLGSRTDRNHVVHRDLSGIARATQTELRTVAQR